MSNEYVVCPKCQGELNAEGFQTDSEDAWRLVTCRKCGFAYNEVYSFHWNESADGAHELDKNGNVVEDDVIILEPVNGVWDEDHTSPYLSRQIWQNDVAARDTNFEHQKEMWTGD
jgi:hypothetical protein